MAFREEGVKAGKGSLKKEQEGRFREEFQRDLLFNKRRRNRGGESIFGRHSGQEDLDQVPRSPDRRVYSGDAKSSPDYARTGLGGGFGEDPSCGPSVLPAAVGREDAACHEEGGASPGVDSRPGTSGQVPGTFGCGLPTFESARKSGRGKPLHGHEQDGAGSTGARNGGHGGQDGEGSPSGQRGLESKGSRSEATRKPELWQLGRQREEKTRKEKERGKERTTEKERTPITREKAKEKKRRRRSGPRRSEAREDDSWAREWQAMQ